MSAFGITRLVTLARILEQPVRQLDALLVPLSHGMTDSHGRLVARPTEIHDRLARSLEEARLAILSAQIVLDSERERTPDAVQSSD